MNRLLETLALILIFLFILECFFIFEGTPDLWDKWHMEAMK